MANAYQLSTGSLAWWPANDLSLQNFAMNHAGDQIEFLIQAKEAISITRLGFRSASKTGTTPTYKISLQGINSSGRADGTIKGGGSPASATFSPTSLSWSNATFQWLTLDNAYACTRGEFLAVVIGHDSGTIDGSNYMSVTTTTTNAVHRFPCYVTYDGNTSTATRSGTPLVGYGSSGTAYGAPIQSASQTSFNSGSAADELATRFTLPSGWGNTYQVAGFRMLGAFAAGGTTKFNLYSGGGASDTTVIASATFTHDYVSSNSGGNFLFYFSDTTIPTLNFGSTYRLGIQPQGAQNVTINWMGVASQADFEAFPMGQNFGYSSRVDGGNWTDDLTQRLAIEPILVDITEPSGGGGGGGIPRGRLVNAGG